MNYKKEIIRQYGDKELFNQVYRNGYGVEVLGVILGLIIGSIIVYSMWSGLYK